MRLRFLNRLDKVASGLAANGEETRLATIIRLNPVRVIEQTGAEGHANQVGINCNTPGKQIVQHLLANMVRNRSKRFLRSPKHQRIKHFQTPDR